MLLACIIVLSVISCHWAGAAPPMNADVTGRRARCTSKCFRQKVDDLQHKMAQVFHQWDNEEKGRYLKRLLELTENQNSKVEKTTESTPPLVNKITEAQDPFTVKSNELHKKITFLEDQLEDSEKKYILQKVLKLASKKEVDNFLKQHKYKSYPY